MPRMHDDELDLDEELVRVLLAAQFPAWAGLSIDRVEPSGSDGGPEARRTRRP